jgi:hypothetical protein
MRKHCTYCSSEIGFIRIIKGESFCSAEHAELHLKEQSQKAFARVLDFCSPPPAHKVKAPMSLVPHGLCPSSLAPTAVVCLAYDRF